MRSSHPSNTVENLKHNRIKHRSFCSSCMQTEDNQLRAFFIRYIALQWRRYGWNLSECLCCEVAGLVLSPGEWSRCRIAATWPWRFCFTGCEDILWCRWAAVEDIRICNSGICRKMTAEAGHGSWLFILVFVEGSGIVVWQRLSVLREVGSKGRRRVNGLRATSFIYKNWWALEDVQSGKNGSPIMVSIIQGSKCWVKCICSYW